MLVGAGGFAGSVCRYLVSIWITAPGSAAMFPMATFAVNAAGSLLIGIFISALGSNDLRLLLATGFCGGFTTFSAFSAEALSLWREGQICAGAGYALASVAVCVAMVMAGIVIGTKIKGI
ncbi:MAG: fluoride efflux transporter CrcB [Rikenellaceae bacterium]|nr:fluoride efflux transporter CrcB [Rikenellaceae bacterium]